MSATPPSAEHEIMTYVRVEDKLRQLVEDDPNPMKMEMDSTLSEALDAMSCIPSIQFPVLGDHTTPPHNCAFTIANAPAGTFGNPDIDLIMKNSTPSQFGRGSESVMDPAYRTGREIPAANIGFDDSTAKVLQWVRVDVKVMFPGHKVELKPYKLAIYEPGGHFDWHMDSTHSDKHHATLLVALNTSWKGGDLVLRRNGGTETHVKLQPESGDNDEPILQAVAFFTDTDHRVEPVTEGTRIVLQYDIEVGEKQEDTTDDYSEMDSLMHKVQSAYSSRMEFQGIAQATADQAAVEKVLAIITELHKSGVEEVAFALQHLYRKAAITAQYLKGSDAVLYNTLLASGVFQVSLHPVVLREISDHEGAIDERFAYRYDVEMDTTATSDRAPPAKKKRKSREFHIPKLSGIQQISARDFVENVGNEAMAAEYRYFGGGMFIRAK
jgi:predicted 2-oxoglutarate/Fe(II)-dependent dioxygenase YbiX